MTSRDLQAGRSLSTLAVAVALLTPGSGTARARGAHVPAGSCHTSWYVLEQENLMASPDPEPQVPKADEAT